jgi:hypothetical protein
MSRIRKHQYATDIAWYRFAADPRKDTQLTTGLGIDANRLEAIKQIFEQVVTDDNLLHVSFRGRTNTQLREATIQKVMRRVTESKSAPKPWVHKAMQNLLARTQSNMRKKDKARVGPGSARIVGVEAESAAVVESQLVSAHGHTQTCGCGLDRLSILLRAQELDGTISVLYMDVASSLVTMSPVTYGIRAVEYHQLLKMYTSAGVDCDKVWIWANHMDAMPIGNDGALRAALSRAIYSKTDQVVFTAIRRDGK